MRYTIWTKDCDSNWEDTCENLSEREAVKMVRELRNVGVAAVMAWIGETPKEVTSAETEQRHSP